MDAPFVLTLLSAALWQTANARDVLAGPALTKTQITVISKNGAETNIRKELQARNLTGEYWQGSGLGPSLGLSLRDGGKFECTLAGCLGMLGSASGKWSICESGINLIVEKVEGHFMESPFRSLQVLTYQDHYLFVPVFDRDRFKKLGASRWSCFHKEGAGKALIELEHQRIDEAIKILKEKYKK